MQKLISTFIISIFLSIYGIKAQGLESVTFSAVATNNDNFQPIAGIPYGASLSGANGSLEISAAYGQSTYEQSTLSSDKISAANEIKVWPNPADYLINIDLTKLPAGEYHLELLDLNSKLIMTKNTKETIPQIDLGLLSVGTYILRVRVNTSSNHF